jgi:histone H3/H4
MGIVTKQLSYAAVRRLAQVEPELIIERKAVRFAIEDAEAYIQDLFRAAIPFMKHRKGTMLMQQDIEAYLASITPVVPDTK